LVKQFTLNNSKEFILSLLEQVSDPEIPVLTIVDLGIVRDVNCINDDEVEITITPTYSGCPAMDAIAFDIKLKLLENGFKKVNILYSLSPAWTTDWMSESGKKKLQSYGIAPPQNITSRIEKLLFEEESNIECPRCHSAHTKLLSQFGSTACKALYQCIDCKEPFDYFKCH
jgi:ring-1,2-phenylacetyl-CoA epoxidase subunit PaaD